MARKRGSETSTVNRYRMRLFFRIDKLWPLFGKIVHQFNQKSREEHVDHAGSQRDRQMLRD